MYNWQICKPNGPTCNLNWCNTGEYWCWLCDLTSYHLAHSRLSVWYVCIYVCPHKPKDKCESLHCIQNDLLWIICCVWVASGPTADLIELNGAILCENFRDSDAFILAGLDDVQSLLDDHILKSQSMRGSPFIAALGKRATDWEEKLINMQDIMDIWLKVQSTWMYLEPIFNSEDIMRQMPVEGRNFKAVRIHQ